METATYPNPATLACLEKKLGTGSQPLESVTVPPKEARGPPSDYTQPYPPLAFITRPTVPTEQAAYYLNRRPQTLRVWACHEDGPLRPIRINGRLAWPVAELRRLLGVA